MIFLLCILAIAMVATGLSALTFGLPIIQNERGWAMVIAGSVGASGGAVLLGVALAR
jgi:energy-converting hydrogenase Eha subunit A